MKFKIFLFLALMSCGRTSQSESGAGDFNKAQIGRITSKCDENYKTFKKNALTAFLVEDYGASKKVRTTHLNELMQLPSEIRRFLKSKRVKVLISSGSVTGFSDLSYLSGKIPRGWEDTGYTWDSVPGAGNKTAVYLGHPGLPHSAHSLALHEAGHSIDFNASLSTSYEWRRLYQYWSKFPNWDDAIGNYRMSHIEEFVASSLDDYFCSNETRGQLDDWYPGVSEAIESFISDLS